jgi:hypothetical protein
VSGKVMLGDVASILQKVRVREAKKKKTARAVTGPMVGQGTQTKGLDTRFGVFKTTL